MDDQNPQKMQAENFSTHNRLRQLQNYSRSNLAALITQRSSSIFTLHDEPVPAEASDRVLVVVYPQDPFVSEPEVRTMSVSDIQPNMLNSRVRIQDRRGELAIPNSDGNYMYWPGDPRFDQVNAFYFTTFTLRMYERYARRPLPWSFSTPRITVDPYAGAGPNAFYSEQDQLIGYLGFELNGKPNSTAWSADIISHETGHAILDGLRDLYNETFSLGPNAFHESFGDISAILVALHDDSLIRRLLDWTKGDLRTSNFVTEVAEHLAKALSQEQSDHVREHTFYLRNAINGFKQVPFDELPYHPIDPDIQLGRQPHNYSRLFTGAFYDILVGIHDYVHHHNGVPPHIAIYSARNVLAHLLVAAVELGPVGEFDFSDMALAFIMADEVLYEGRHYDILTRVFDERGILSPYSAHEAITAQRRLPDVRLPKSINSAMASALFLEREIIPALKLNPALELIPMAAYRNAAGYAYLTYFSLWSTRLQGAPYDRVGEPSIEMFGGLTLMFDPENRLRSVFHRPVKDEDIRQMKVLTAELINQGLIAESNRAAFLPLPPQRMEGVVVIEPPMHDSFYPPQRQIIRLPVSVDEMPQIVSDFVEYLHKIKRKIST